MVRVGATEDTFEQSLEGDEGVSPMDIRGWGHSKLQIRENGKQKTIY